MRKIKDGMKTLQEWINGEKEKGIQDIRIMALVQGNYRKWLEGPTLHARREKR